MLLSLAIRQVFPAANAAPARKSAPKNCFAHFGEDCSDDFGCGGRRLTGVSQGRQVQKYRTGPPKCGTGSAPVGPKNKSLHPTTGTKAKKFRGTTRFRPRYNAAALTMLNAHHTPVIGRSSRANQTSAPAGGLQPGPPFSVRCNKRYFPIHSNNIGYFNTLLYILQVQIDTQMLCDYN